MNNGQLPAATNECGYTNPFRQSSRRIQAGKYDYICNYRKSDNKNAIFTTEQSPTDDFLSHYVDMSAKEMATQAKSLQQNTAESTARSKNTIQQTAQIGTGIQITLAKQNEQLRQVDAGLDRVDGNIRQAEHQVRAFLRRMATDKLIMVMLILVILATIACFIVPFVVKRK